MATEIKVPGLPESVSDATIASWHKKVGVPVSRDENIVDLGNHREPLAHNGKVTVCFRPVSVRLKRERTVRQRRSPGSTTQRGPF